MLVGFLAADISLIDFDSVGKPELAIGTGFPDPVQHVPSGAILDAKFLRHLHRAHALAGRHHGIDRIYPIRQRRLRGMQGRPGRDGEVLPARLAPVRVRLALWLRHLLLFAAMRAGGLVLPTHIFEPLDAGVVVREHPHDFNDADGFCTSLCLRHVSLSLFVQNNICRLESDVKSNSGLNFQDEMSCKESDTTIYCKYNEVFCQSHRELFSVQLQEHWHHAAQDSEAGVHRPWMAFGTS